MQMIIEGIMLYLQSRTYLLLSTMLFVWDRKEKIRLCKGSNLRAVTPQITPTVLQSKRLNIFKIM